MSTSIALTFQDTQFDIIDHNKQPWLRVHQIGEALGYKNPDRSLTNLYNANADEFTEAMTALVELETNGGKQQVRIFSLRGCHLLGMLSKTKIAKEFRKWVLDILDKQLLENIEQLPEPKTKQALAGGLTLEQQDCVKALIRQRVTELPKDKQGGAAVKCWSSIKKKYGKTYKAVEPEHFISIISLLGRLPLEGELVEPDPIQQDSITINLAPLGKGGQSRKIVMIQHESGLVDLWGVNQASDAKRKEAFIKDLVDDGYIVMKKSEMVDRLTK